MSNSKDKVYSVYNDAALFELKKLTDINISVCYTKEDILSDYCISKDTEYIFSTWGMPFFSKEEIHTVFPSLKHIFYAAGSVQHFARPFLESGIYVHSSYKANAIPVAEYTVSQIILANKGFFLNCFYQSNNLKQKAADIRNNIKGTYGCNVGIIGAGAIGSLVISMLKTSYKVNILVFDPFLSDDKALKMGVKKVSLNKLFSDCAVISNHLANNEQTKGMLDYSCFSLMGKYSTFINTGRGAQVIEKDLIKALKEDTTRCAVLDVTDPEPPSDDSPLFTMQNVFLTSHIAGSLSEELYRMSEYMVDEFKRVLLKEELCHQVTLEMLSTMA